MAMDYQYVKFPDAHVYKQYGTKLKKVKHLLFGDWVSVLGDAGGDLVNVTCRGARGVMRKSDLQKEKVLEVVFVDIGQGDGCFLVTPDDEFMVIDAGEGDNMARFLAWRFAGFKKTRKFDAAVISHPDQDHYGGFKSLFDIQNLSFERFYTNGLVERAGGPNLGATAKVGRTTFQVDLALDSADLDAVINDPAKRGSKNYAKMLFEGRAKIGGHQMLGLKPSGDGSYSVDSAPFDWLKTPGMRIEVLGPVMEPVGGGFGLRRLGSNDGVTKNGHSVVLKLVYKNVRLLLGGDLNIPSENLLLEKHTGLESPAGTAAGEEDLIKAARAVFEVDVAKSCHHGSADVSEVFLRCVNAAATVISSGDNEPHAHPRSDTLGLVGKSSRGRRPLIFCTELARSGKEKFDLSDERIDELVDKRRELKAMAANDPGRADLAKKIETLERLLGRAVATYGAIQLRTDGERVVLAYKVEQSSAAKGWDIYKLEPSPSGELTYVSQHD
jgi:beta-lactamase superfamily II metal-dependent hydrolase